jgi:hypothetical protein
MSDEEAPPPESVPPDSPPERKEPSPSKVPPAEKESRRRRLEGVIPEIVRRAVELGVEKAQEAPGDLKHFVGDLKLPKEIVHYLLGQIDETKNGLFRVVAKEIRDFLEHTNFGGEVEKLLTTVQFEVNTTIRFTPNDGQAKKKAASVEDPPAEDAPAESGEASERRTPLPRPEVKTAVHVRREDRDRRRRDRGT